MTRLWLDTEFNGFGGKFISAALVAEDGSHWYQAVGCNNPVQWTAEHILPRIGIHPVTLAALQASLRVFLSKFDQVTIIADWPTDIEHFCNLLSIQPFNGNIICTPPITFELKTWLNGNGESVVPHNALEDARANMRYDLTAHGHS
jgi:hypothetical protein